MKTNVIAALLIGVILGAAGYGLSSRMARSGSWHPTEEIGAMPGMIHGTATPATPTVGAGGSMDQMMADLPGKTGDEFDAAFLSEMITHHQGALDMADLAATRAKHQEIKDLAGAIVTTQTEEISRMRGWQQAWGYGLR